MDMREEEEDREEEMSCPTALTDEIRALNFRRLLSK
jgi:hypothetical protein